jgi:hypothetical protein
MTIVKSRQTLTPLLLVRTTTRRAVLPAHSRDFLENFRTCLTGAVITLAMNHLVLALVPSCTYFVDCKTDDDCNEGSTFALWENQTSSFILKN